MARKDIITMSQKELKRHDVIHNVLGKAITQRKAADILDLSDRQIRRIVKRVRKESVQKVQEGAFCVQYAVYSIKIPLRKGG